MDEQDQDVQRTPLWPPDPEPGSEAPRSPTPAPVPSPEQTPGWAAGWAPDAPPEPPPAAPPYQPYQPYQPHQPYQPTADTPSAPATAQPQSWPSEADSWPSASDPWEAPAPAAAQQVSDAPTMRVSAAPTPMQAVPLSEAPTQQHASVPASTPPTALADAPTQQYASAPLPMPPAPPADMPAPRRATTPPAPPAPPADAPAPPTPASAPPAAPTIPPAPPRKRSGTLWRLGVTLVICALLLVGALSVYNHAAALAAEPQRVMTNYCAALTHDDYRTAYSLLSSSAQAQQPEAQYLADAASRDSIEGRITTCSAKPTQELSALSFLRSPRSLIFNAQITRKQAATGQIALTRDAQGWHVAALSSPLQGIDLGPLATQQALCKAFSQRAYSEAYALLSTPYQHDQGNAATFARSFGATLTITACAANLKTYSVNSSDQQSTFDVTLTLSFVGATSGSAPTTFTLPTKWAFVREATGWRVDEIKPLLAQ